MQSTAGCKKPCTIKQRDNTRNATHRRMHAKKHRTENHEASIGGGVARDAFVARCVQEGGHEDGDDAGGIARGHCARGLKSVRCKFKSETPKTTPTVIYKYD